MKRFAVCLFLTACEYANDPAANITRIDEPGDGLAVYHDAKRGVTCYCGASHISCVPDLWLKSETGK